MTLPKIFGLSVHSSSVTKVLSLKMNFLLGLSAKFAELSKVMKFYPEFCEFFSRETFCQQNFLPLKQQTKLQAGILENACNCDGKMR